MEWSPQQDAALSKARRWLDDPTAPQVHRLFGFAGTGKSTLAHELNDHVNGEALACAYTGKAASVMARKGLPGATTIHRLIYNPTDGSKEHLNKLKEELRLLEEVTSPSRGLLLRTEAVRRAVQEAEAQSKQPQFLLKEESEVSRAPLVILDECSMVNERMAKDLLSFGVKVLVLGDPAQLPPVKGTGYFIDAEPDSLLTEVHRQAKGNAIIEIATMIRNNRVPSLGDYGEVQVVERVNAELALGADQVLCGTNARRRSINARHRQLGGHTGPMPNGGERVVCLKNNHDLGLLNGQLFDVMEDVEWFPGDSQFHMRIVPDTGGLELGVPVEASIFIDEDQKPQWGSAEQFTYGYCLTVHKSQGSQWDNVLLFNDWSRRSDSYFNWLYTGVTRAAERLTLVL
jgi:exodeoxyribonuclease V